MTDTGYEYPIDYESHRPIETWSWEKLYQELKPRMWRPAIEAKMNYEYLVYRQSGGFWFGCKYKDDCWFVRYGENFKPVYDVTHIQEFPPIPGSEESSNV